MESLAYLHSALAYEQSAAVESDQSSGQPDLFDGFNWKKFSNRAFLFSLPLLITFGAFATPQEAQAARFLKYGKRGADVVRLQKQMKYQGYFPYRVRATGYFGRITRRSVRSLQRNCGVRVDGIVGPQTRTYCL